MDVEKLFHMSPGFGETSYAKNSSFQKKGSDMVKHMKIAAVKQAYLSSNPESMGIADLGCSCGPNTISIIREIIEAVGEVSSGKKIKPEVRVYLNDLPTNDFNSVFRSLPDLYEQLKNKGGGGGGGLFIAACPGSFYGRLFPNNTLHFVHSSFSLHWLSKVPPEIYDEEGKSMNKGSIYICESSPPLVSQAYYSQFKQDFSLFLESRSQELCAGGYMVLILLGRVGSDHVDRGNSFFWELLSRSFSVLVSRGEVEKEKVDLYDVHFYVASRDEIEDEIKREGSFELIKFEMFETLKDCDIGNYGRDVAMAVRAVQGSMISHHFGDSILDSLFDIYARILDEEIVKQEINPISFATVLKKL